MKTKFAATALIVASGLFAGTSAFAESSLTDANDIYTFGAMQAQPMKSGVTRAQVTAEFVRAHRTGEHLMPAAGRGEDKLVPDLTSLKQTPSTVTREQVNAEFKRAHRTGEHKEVRISGRDDDAVTSQL